MEFSEYSRRARVTAVYPSGSGMSGVLYTILGLNGEAGEAAEHLKKTIRDDAGVLSPHRRELLLKELGDILWYLDAASRELGSDLDEVAQINIDKLTDRDQRGMIHGDGDER